MKKKKGTHALVEYVEDKILHCVPTDQLLRSTMSKIKIEETVKAKFCDGKFYDAKVISLGGKFLISIPNILITPCVDVDRCF